MCASKSDEIPIVFIHRDGIYIYMKTKSVCGNDDICVYTDNTFTSSNGHKEIEWNGWRSRRKYGGRNSKTETQSKTESASLKEEWKFKDHNIQSDGLYLLNWIIQNYKFWRPNSMFATIVWQTASPFTTVFILKSLYIVVPRHISSTILYK